MELTSISPIDGRYRRDVLELALFFSEEALIKYRVRVEIEYLIAISREPQINDLSQLSSIQQSQLRRLYEYFSAGEAEQVKAIEVTTNHDVKAVEYYLREKLTELGLEHLVPWIHFALTSEDVNNLAYSLMWQDALTGAYLPALRKVDTLIKRLAKRYQNTAILALTHGQPATPTTLGKELSVFSRRLNRQFNFFKTHRLQGKFGGATGTWSAHVISYPSMNWITFAERFIKSLGLEPNLITTQIEPHDSLTESYQALSRINTILTDLCRDIWMYISRGIFCQKSIAGEVGSSTMPHKINPIQFENAEGNLGVSSALLNHLAAKLPISRMQRDLSNSTVLRNQGVAMAHSLLALKNILKGLNRITINKATIKKELDEHWEVLAEAVQTILRKSGKQDAYEQLKKFTQGQKITKESLRSFLTGLDISNSDKELLLSLTPATFTGLASKLVDLE